MLWILAEEQAFQDTQPEPLDFNYMIREWEEKWQGVGKPMARPSPEMERDASGMQAWIIDKGGVKVFPQVITKTYKVEF